MSNSLPGQLARTQGFTLGVPGQFTVAADGSAVLFLRSRAGDDPVICLWALDLDSGAERILADPADLLGSPAPGIGAYATDRVARLVTFTLADESWTLDTAAGHARRLPAESPVADPRPDAAEGRHAPCATRRRARPMPRSRCGSQGSTARGRGCAGSRAPSSTFRAPAGTTMALTPSFSPAISAPSGFSGSTRLTARGAAPARGRPPGDGHRHRREPAVAPGSLPAAAFGCG